MSNTEINQNVLYGGQFLIKDPDVNHTFIPEEFNEEQLMVKQMAQDFMTNTFEPMREKVEKMEDGVTVNLLNEAAALGLLGTHMPANYGGTELDTNTNTLINEVLGSASSWIVSYAAHTGIGMLPILYFGTEEQKSKYLPRLISGELKAAYCLTEPGSGSDALAAKTRADLSEDGSHYVLNGQKMWITNAGFADIFIVFAQIGGDKFTGFIVERNLPGITLGAEEAKMGIKGSSTRQVFFENVQVPSENLLGEIGKGHKIAFNVLNIGRFKLAVMCMGGSKGVVNMSTQYANERIQFKQAIAKFGAIQYKLAEMATRLFALESTVYRVSNKMEEMKDALQAEGQSYSEAINKSAEEYAIECSILKVFGSEVLDYVVDENVQIHGGIGFSEEYGAARAYRDARINRIFEGTNEINRLLIVDMLLKRAMQGKIDLVGPAWEVQKELASMPDFETVEGQYANERKAIKDFKKIILMVAGAAVKMQMDGNLNLEKEQELLMNIADLITDTYTAESLFLRVDKLHSAQKAKVDQNVYDAMLKVFIHDATHRMVKNGTDALCSFAEGDLLKTLLMGLKRYTKYPPVNVKESRRLIAEALLKNNAWCF